MNHYFTSTGERVSKSVIDSRVRKAKAQKIESMIDEYGYVFCEDCRRNDCKPVDCSHDISVKKCQEERMVQFAWDVDNITMRGRRCHQKHDNLYLRF